MSSLGKILVADDDAPFLKSTATLLRQEGYDWDTAPDAAEAATLLLDKTQTSFKSKELGELRKKLESLVQVCPERAPARTDGRP